MHSIYRTLAMLPIAVAAAILTVHSAATAQSEEDLCRFASCTKGPSKCADVTGTYVNELCDEGVMCCPFPEESFVVHCFEHAT